VKLVLEWIKANGGTAGMQQRAIEKSKLIYDVIDSSSFFHSPVDPPSAEDEPCVPSSQRRA
jgi:phosphoserine aminotransferase